MVCLVSSERTISIEADLMILIENSCVARIYSNSRISEKKGLNLVFCPDKTGFSGIIMLNYCYELNKHLIKDLPWEEIQFFLKVNRQQFQYAYCQTPFSEDLNVMGQRKKYTERYPQWIAERVMNSNLLNVA